MPITVGEVRMYVCGVTVYDYCHIGHARMFVVFDTVTRFLRNSGYKVCFVQNITDIDDKIIRRAQKENKTHQAITDYFIQAMHEDRHALNVLSPDFEPRATEYLPQIVHLIECLLQAGLAYVASNGDVYYQVSLFKNYGALTQQDVEKLAAGARIEITEAKREPLDFALWKMAKPGEPAWPSPWGMGRPGWHIECSAMSTALLGEHFDIHGGGLDLQFPHHENEIAQSVGASNKKFVNVWMHNGFVQINEEKMSKSLNNFFTIREVLKHYPAEVVRYFLIASHYRSPINYSEQNLSQAYAALRRLYGALRGLPMVMETADKGNFRERFSAAMEDDFNTPIALSVLFDCARLINQFKADQQLDVAAKHAALLRVLADNLGLLYQQPEEFLKMMPEEEDEEVIAQQIAERNQARQRKDWHTADQIRNQLLTAGIVLEDTATGTVWRKI